MANRSEGESGLCGRCAHCHAVTNARGSTFHLCKRSETDPRFARYPRLPVLTCPGFEARDAATKITQPQ